MKDFLNKRLNIQEIKFDRIDRSVNRNDRSPWQVIEMTEHMLCKATNDDFLKETSHKEKSLKKVKQLRDAGK